MTQKFFLHDAASAVTGTLPATGSSQSATTPTVTATGAGTNRLMNGTIGTLQVAASLATVASATLQNSWFRRFVSPPIAAQTIAAGQWTNGLAGLTTSTANSNFSFDIVLYLWRPSTGSRIGYIYDQAIVGQPGSTSETAASVTMAVSTAQTALDGDVLILEMWGQANQGMASSFTWTFDYDGTVSPTSGAISSAASFINAPADIPLSTGSTFLAGFNKPILQAVKRAANWCKHERRGDSGLYTPRRRVLLPTSS